MYKGPLSSAPLSLLVSVTLHKIGLTVLWKVEFLFRYKFRKISSLNANEDVKSSPSSPKKIFISTNSNCSALDFMWREKTKSLFLEAALGWVFCHLQPKRPKLTHPLNSLLTENIAFFRLYLPTIDPTEFPGHPHTLSLLFPQWRRHLSSEWKPFSHMWFACQLRTLPW